MQLSKTFNLSGRQKWAYKVFFGLLALSSITWEISALIAAGTFSPAHFFAYFTIQVNMLVVLALLRSAFVKQPGTLDSFRSAVTVYILVVGIVFSILLAGVEGATFTAVPWNNIVLHHIMPVAVAFDYYFDRPRRVKLRYATAWLVYPIIYLGFTMVRGALEGWYPYPFLNLNVAGVSSVFVILLGIFGIVVVLATIVWRGGSRSNRAP